MIVCVSFIKEYYAGRLLTELVFYICFLFLKLGK